MIYKLGVPKPIKLTFSQFVHNIFFQPALYSYSVAASISSYYCFLRSCSFTLSVVLILGPLLSGTLAIALLSCPLLRLWYLAFEMTLVLEEANHFLKLSMLVMENRSAGVKLYKLGGWRHWSNPRGSYFSECITLSMTNQFLFPASALLALPVLEYFHHYACGE